MDDIMLDCENRLRAAEHFFERARDQSLSETQHIWYIQATVIFAIAAIENLLYDFSERKTGKSLKQTKLTRNDLRSMSCSAFCDWIEQQESRSPLYNFLRAERHLIVHRGEPPKRARLVISQPLGGGEATWTVTHCFEGWEQESIDDACRSLIQWVEGVIKQTKAQYPEIS